MIPPSAPELSGFTDAASKEGLCAGSDDTNSASITAERRNMVWL